ncbi:MAG: hypothetical protein PHU95_00470 [Candidatus Thermoplasmatota archaeon]|nr:hypothetical protein [Candidatus Thermoplasmatota archaeon]MDD5777912.1 hypothetical protein [Candidatus Thermoplasmatota archaeon]
MDPMAVQAAVETYNRYRSPEATAVLLQARPASLEVLFTGSLCHTCGCQDYLEDLVVFLEEQGVRATVESIAPGRQGLVVTYLLL